MIVLFTDFGLHGPYTGQVKAVLHQMAPGVPAIDLFADAPVGNPKASAYLLAAYAAWFPVGTVFLCIVDPGVGGTRPAIVLEADGRWYVGPGNGLFELIQRYQGHSGNPSFRNAPSSHAALTFRHRCFVWTKLSSVSTIISMNVADPSPAIAIRPAKFGSRLTG
jgi:S-adenosylmethionine hydrolase